MCPNLEKLKAKLSSLIEFFDPFRSLVNSHLGEFFTDELWSKNLPVKIQEELNDMESLNEFTAAFPRLIRDQCTSEFYIKYKHVSNFVKAANDISLRKDSSCLISSNELENHLLNLNCAKECIMEFEEFMSKKKLHEVRIISRFIAMLKNLTKTSHVVDIGGGKGYLSSTLVLQYNCKVLGLDSSDITTCGAFKLSENIAKYWKSCTKLKSKGKHLILEKNTCDNQDSKITARQENVKLMEEHYKQIIEYVTSKTDIMNLVNTNFSDPCTGICLVGLHTCGNLAPTSLRIFAEKESIKSLLNIGCCYQHLNEQFYDKFCKKEAVNFDEFGFPMSKFLKDKKFCLGRNAMMLSQHSIDRYSATFPDSKAEVAERSILYRAILEVIIRMHKCFKEGYISRLGKHYADFHDYVRKALSKLDLDIQMNDEELTSIYEFYKTKLPILRAYFLIRVNLAPVIESIILLDRLLYLRESGIENSFLVPFFDRSISPRGFGLIAWKSTS